MKLKSILTIIIISVSVTTLLGRKARADRRAYGETYEAVTAAPAELDVELWHTYADGGGLGSGPPTPGHRSVLELEYGLTARWDLALYNMFDVDTDEPGYAGLKIESRFRLALPGALPVDPVLYLEYQRLFRGDARDKVELKGILGRDLGPWNFALNIGLELERTRGAGLEPEVELALGVSRELGSPAFKLGAELFGTVERENETGGEEETEAHAFAGPALSWAAGGRGPLRGFWITVAAGRGLAATSGIGYGRAIVGLQF